MRLISFQQHLEKIVEQNLKVLLDNVTGIEQSIIVDIAEKQLTLLGTMNEVSIRYLHTSLNIQE